MRWRIAAVAALVVPLTSACQGGDPSTHPLEGSTQSPRRVMSIDDPRVSESSGLARSHLHPGVLYTHNDQGGAPEIFAVDATGVRAVLRLNVAARDWEDLASTPDDRLWIADIGDNDEVRRSVSVTVLSEPTVLASSTLPSTTYKLRYPDGPHNAEALLVHPRTGRIYVVTKSQEAGRVYVAPARLTHRGPNLLEPVGAAPTNVTAGAFSADGSLLVLRNQGRAFFYRSFDDQPTEVELPKQPQGESILFEEDGTHVLVGSEGDNSQVLRVAVPDALVKETP